MRPTLLTACLLTATTLLQHLTLVSSALLNITVDDQDPTTLTTTGVSFTADWLVGRAGQSCILCIAHVDPAQVRDGTWHEAVYDPTDATNPAHATPQNATLPFTGSAVYVYGVQVQSTAAPFGGADLVFYVDGTNAGDYEYTPTGPQGAYVYDKMLFSVEGLPNTAHNLTVQNGRHGGPASLAVLDYIVYTQGDSSGFQLTSSISTTTTVSSLSPPSATTFISTSTFVEPVPTSASHDTSQHGGLGAPQIAAICISIAAAFIILALATLVCRVRRRRRAARELTAAVPFEDSAAGEIQSQYRLSEFKPLKDARQGPPVVSWAETGSTAVGTPIADAMMCARGDERVELAAGIVRSECACGVGPPAYEHVSRGVV
ncbi:hypothetical protein PsYK624_054100 [Phanerochaete sordida]|uniref:Uncharacterized protein n=1 Tax=Phanerochaete sordida TaxID=48140 RepID=A0A9P3G523_9APHY|nr:hypothetical protein PsYK624_054100 [Phanerochaete sordida]